MQIYRQGDVIVRPIEKSPEASKLDHLTLAHGEVTGHRHRITKGQATLYQTIAGLLFLKVISERATLFHEEHEDIDLPVGDYEILIQREYDWFTEEVYNVAD